jgi:hypothetical protein
MSSSSRNKPPAFQQYKYYLSHTLNLEVCYAPTPASACSHTTNAFAAADAARTQTAHCPQSLQLYTLLWMWRIYPSHSTCKDISLARHPKHTPTITLTHSRTHRHTTCTHTYRRHYHRDHHDYSRPYAPTYQRTGTPTQIMANISKLYLPTSQIGTSFNAIEGECRLSVRVFSNGEPMHLPVRHPFHASF